MSILKVKDIAFVRFSAPDLEQMRAFLDDFGLASEVDDKGDLYAHGSGGSAFVHSTTQGDPAFLGVGFYADSVDDLHKLADAQGVSVEPLNAPGGGSVVRLNDPDGISVEVVAGQQTREAGAFPSHAGRNDARTKERVREPLRLEDRPAQVVRLGHAVLEVSDFRTSERWYKDLFGFITSDEIEAEPGAAIGAFLRCDRGDQPTDHHTLFLLQSANAPRLNHAAFEVVDLDDLMCGHAHLKKAQRTPAWGVGRHVLGSQVFDYWRDPWGNELEHWTDGDLFTVEDGSRTATLSDLLNVQWGPLHPMMAGGAK
ncbi:MAG: glyoxalase [Ponticaulis sp.]|nr:glyoxalase [Ponticaulis sp.]|tara:strand:+ start:17104 stop:18039 length:936 start_codon:yes stop_codon:yes gene_type:complete